MKTLRTFFISIIVLFLFGCASSHRGLGGISSPLSTEEENHSFQEGLEVLLTTDYQVAIEIAEQALKAAFPRANIENRHGDIYLHNQDFWQGDVQSKIEGIRVRNKLKEEIGITYNIESVGVGINASMGPGYIASGFFDELRQIVSKRGVGLGKFVEFEYLKHKGKIEFVSASTPTSIIGFKKYFESLSEPDDLEGIWVLDSGEYTIGIARNTKDPLYEFVGFILDAQTGDWAEGEIKCKFTKASVDGIVIGKWKLANKFEVGVTFKGNQFAMAATTENLKNQLTLIKTFPKNAQSSSGSNLGSGSAWAINKSGAFITNHHVVAGASKIWIGTKNNSPEEARVILADPKLDLAILKIRKPKKNYGATPSIVKAAKTGEPITVVGFPLTETLGDTPKVTTGIISSQSGFKGDVINYQISAPLQPGNSGGPVFNRYGEIVGVAVAKLKDSASQDYDVENVNFAVKSNYLINLLDQAGVSFNSTRTGLRQEPDEIFDKFKEGILPVWTE